VAKPNGEETLVFDRTPVARLISCASVFASAALLFDYLSRGRENLHLLPLIGLSLLVIGTFLSALLQYGDHIYLNADGLIYRNKLLPLLRSERWMRWEEIIEVREIRRKILVLFAEDDRRLLVDAIAGYEIARREIVRRARNAVFSGTLAEESES
jgi:hypothetical protein